MRLSPAAAQRAFVPLVAAAMSGVMSFALNLLHMGWADGFARAWLGQWALGFSVALPTALVVVPAIRALLAALTLPQSADTTMSGVTPYRHAIASREVRSHE